jgi:hypothetical protein
MTPPDDPATPLEPTVLTLDEARAAIARHRAAGAPPLAPEEIARREAVIREVQAAIRALPDVDPRAIEEIRGDLIDIDLD